jgi:hypothetical protein
MLGNSHDSHITKVTCDSNPLLLQFNRGKTIRILTMAKASDFPMELILHIFSFLPENQEHYARWIRRMARIGKGLQTVDRWV